MAKRFTDTDKWKREWFCDLDPKAKLVWFYLLDQCDHRGVWFRNFRLIKDQLGFAVTAVDLQQWFGSKIRLFDGDKYFIPSFVEFQYGTLNPGNNAHKSVIELVEKLEKAGAGEPLRSPSGGAQDKDTATAKDKVINGGVGVPERTDPVATHPTILTEIRFTPEAQEVIAILREDVGNRLTYLVPKILDHWGGAERFGSWFVAAEKRYRARNPNAGDEDWKAWIIKAVRDDVECSQTVIA